MPALAIYVWRYAVAEEGGWWCPRCGAPEAFAPECCGISIDRWRELKWSSAALRAGLAGTARPDRPNRFGTAGGAFLAAANVARTRARRIAGGA